MSLLPEINQASAEINKFVAQANIHQTIAPVNPAEFTSPADTLLLASMDPVIREVSVGMTGVEAVQNTVSGTPPLSLPNSLGKPLKAWSVDVLPYQEGTGDPSPSNVRPIHGTDKLNLFVEESYDQSATPKAVITLPQTVYTGTIGSEGGESRWGEVDLGTLTWQKNSTVFYASFSGNPDKSSSALGYDYLCSIFKRGTSVNAIWNETAEGLCVEPTGVSSQSRIYARNSAYSEMSADEFKSAMSGIYVYYELQNPIQFPLPSPTIPTPTGTATTWATAEDGTVDGMEVTYIKSE